MDKNYGNIVLRDDILDNLDNIIDNNENNENDLNNSLLDEQITNIDILERRGFPMTFINDVKRLIEKTNMHLNDKERITHMNIIKKYLMNLIHKFTFIAKIRPINRNGY